MRNSNALPVLVFLIVFGAGVAFAYSRFTPADYLASELIAAASVVIAGFAAYSIKIANQWERAVVLRLGRFRALEGPGLFFIIPIVDVIPYWIDIRVIATTFKAEKTLTKDTVPVDVDAVLFWKVFDPQRAALDVEDYRSAIAWASQTALRDVIGKTMLADMLEGRERIGNELRRIIDDRTEPWGVNVISVELKDVLIPSARGRDVHAGAGRARTPGAGHPWRFRTPGGREFRRGGPLLCRQSDRLHLRAMNMLYEGLEEAKRDHRHRAQHGGRNDAARRPAGIEGEPDGECADPVYRLNGRHIRSNN